MMRKGKSRRANWRDWTESASCDRSCGLEDRKKEGLVGSLRQADGVSAGINTAMAIPRDERGMGRHLPCWWWLLEGRPPS